MMEDLEVQGKNRFFKCTGCGIKKPCYIVITLLEGDSIDDDIENLRCIVDPTNETSYNWSELFNKQK